MQLQELIKYYNLLPHPEGGYYRQTYLSPENISKEALPERFNGDRPMSTAIYFLIPYGEFSAFHRIKSDEIWHFYKGCPLNIHVIHPNGKYELLKLGQNHSNNESFQHMVPANSWFASEPNAEIGEYAFVGCTVAPGFDFSDFELAHAKELASEYPMQQDLISRLCR